MSNVVWKYFLERPVISMPEGARILHVGVQDNNICIWAEIDPEKPSQERTFTVVGTGQPWTCNTHVYCGTVQMRGLVWHVYECEEVEEISLDA